MRALRKSLFCIFSEVGNIFRPSVFCFFFHYILCILIIESIGGVLLGSFFHYYLMYNIVSLLAFCNSKALEGKREGVSVHGTHTHCGGL